MSSLAVGWYGPVSSSQLLCDSLRTKMSLQPKLQPQAASIFTWKSFFKDSSSSSLEMGNMGLRGKGLWAATHPPKLNRGRFSYTSCALTIRPAECSRPDVFFWCSLLSFPQPLKAKQTWRLNLHNHHNHINAFIRLHTMHLLLDMLNINITFVSSQEISTGHLYYWPNAVI